MKIFDALRQDIDDCKFDDYCAVCNGKSGDNSHSISKAKGLVDELENRINKLKYNQEIHEYEEAFNDALDEILSIEVNNLDNV